MAEIQMHQKLQHQQQQQQQQQCWWQGSQMNQKNQKGVEKDEEHPLSSQDSGDLHKNV